MKRWLQYLLTIVVVVIGVIMASIFFDTINARIFKKSPIISSYEYLDAAGYVDRGIMFDVFYCNQAADVVFVTWKLKGTKYTCPVIEYESMIDITGNVFVKTYTIDTIIKAEDETYQYWTISQFAGEKKEIVKVPVLTQEIQAGKKYEIIFRITNTKIKDNIKSIFENAQIEYISETDKDINQFVG